MMIRATAPLRISFAGTDATTHEKIFVARMNNVFARGDEDTVLQQLWDFAQKGNKSAIIAHLQRLVPTYNADE